eukprot:COSAG05_NODE_367_length_10739_cov_10.311842_6_plen_61_part_00
MYCVFVLWVSNIVYACVFNNRNRATPFSVASERTRTSPDRVAGCEAAATHLQGNRCAPNG